MLSFLKKKSTTTLAKKAEYASGMKVFFIEALQLDFAITCLFLALMTVSSTPAFH